MHQLGKQQGARRAQVACLLLGLVALGVYYSTTHSDSRYRLPSLQPQKAIAPSRHWNGWDKLDYHFVFGDSYSDQSFDVEQAQPSHENPFGNPDSALGVTGGSVWVHYAGLKYNQSYLRTYSLAVGGATVDPSIVGPIGGLAAAAFTAQMETKFKPIYAKKPPSAPWQSNNTLFSVMFGINDVVNSCTDGKRTRFTDIFRSYKRLLEELYESGARNFLFLNVPPFYRSFDPIFPPNGAALMVEDTRVWNQRLAATRDEFLAEHDDATVFLFDTWKLYHEVIQNPAIYPQTAGLRNTTNFCYGYWLPDREPDFLDPACYVPVKEYFWLNFLHPTFVVQEVTAARVVEDCFGAEGRSGYCS